ncbi:MAG: MBL fold metallo-hydrolase [Salinirussus sp.]
MVEKLVPGIWRIDFGGVNAYIIDDADGVTLVDAGMPWHADRLTTALRTVASGPAAVERVLLTHYDFDHAGSFGRVAGLDAPVYAAEPDAGYLTGSARPPWRSRKGLFQRVAGVGVRPPAGPVRTVSDGEILGKFTAIHTPGHTPGHLAFLHEELSTVVLGDLVRGHNGGFDPSPWLLSADMTAVRRSIRDVADRASGMEIGLVGHGPPVVGNAGKRLQHLH